MGRIIEAPKKNLFEQQEQQNKDTKLFSFLQTIDYLCFSDTGLKNIAARFGITVEQLKVKILEFEARAGHSND